MEKIKQNIEDICEKKKKILEKVSKLNYLPFVPKPLLPDLDSLPCKWSLTAEQLKLKILVDNSLKSRENDNPFKVDFYFEFWVLQ